MFYIDSEERGKEFKVPYHASAAATRDGNLPHVTATCYTWRQYALYSDHLPLFPTKCLLIIFYLLNYTPKLTHYNILQIWLQTFCHTNITSYCYYLSRRCLFWPRCYCCFHSYCNLNSECVTKPCSLYYSRLVFKLGYIDSNKSNNSLYICGVGCPID